MKKALGIVGMALAILATSASQAQAQPAKPEFDFDSVRFQTSPGDATFTRAWNVPSPSTEALDKKLEQVFRFCVKHPKECKREEKKHPGLFKRLRSIAKCGAKVIAVIGGNYIAVTKIKKAGGFVKLARELVQAPTRDKKIRILLTFVGEYVGIEEVADSCGFGT